MSDALLTRSKVVALAVPVMLAQAATASTGIVDTAVMGLYGTKFDLGAVGVAAVVMNFLYWAFGFLRMSTTGLTAQAAGGGDRLEAQTVLQRALLLGGALGLTILILSPLLKLAVFQPFEASPEVKSLARDYFDARVWGAPAVLMGYAITGWLLGTGKTGQLLAFQIVMNGTNAALDIWFVAGLGWGPAGIGAGTAIAEWVALAFGLVLVRKGFSRSGELFDRERLAALINANRDILIRTLALLFCFAWFVNSGASLGTATLAGNEVLLQFVSVSAFVLDGFAFVAEKEIGEAYGARSRARLMRAMRLTSEIALACAIFIALAYFIGGGWIIENFVADADARAVALAYLPYCAAVPLIGLACWQLDGFFLGATQGKALRNAGVVAAILYVGTDMLLKDAFANTGVWIAFLTMYVWRAGALGVYLPSMIAKVSESQPRQPAQQT
ncbi:MATE family efflux transporter [Henriciella barbarensis]|uniref:MATE family efflux transporter n=1 Tax=Henriciella barbarensis TaxID=86342 RepID=A0A399QZQ0_9PROT|nr:MATE family efflux transporter [Henriciella barbarensis]RIJ24368.1 MATE family efflux transporter [Henriciella barbarensis]